MKVQAKKPKIRDLIEPVNGHLCLSLYDPESIEELADCGDVEALTMEHFPKIHSLAPVGKMRNLRWLTLKTQLGWDGTNRTLEVETFMPLAELPLLEEVLILGVAPKRDRVMPFTRMKKLKKVTLGNTNFYQLEDFAALSGALPMEAAIRPVMQMNFITPCRKCMRSPELFLNGAEPGKRKYVYPFCHQKLIFRHLERWNVAGGQPQYLNFEEKTPAEVFLMFRNPELDAEWRERSWKK
jgi:hypothetical protein